jgi:hypothetical protein
MQANERHKSRSAPIAHPSTSSAVLGYDFGSTTWPSARIRLLGTIARHAGAENAWRTAERHFTADHPIVKAFKQRALSAQGRTDYTAQARPSQRVVPVMRNFKRRWTKLVRRRELFRKRYALNRNVWGLLESTL